MSLQTRLSSLITAIGADIKALQTNGNIVSSLPGSPVNGQECNYLADSTNGVVWRLKYRTASSKWHFIGGGSMSHSVDASESRAVVALTWADLTTVGPTLTIPLAGDYIVEFGCNVLAPTGYVANASGGAIINVGGTLDGNTNITFGTGPAGGAGNGEQSNISYARKMTFTAAQVVKMQYISAGSAFNFRWRWLKITPIQVS